VKRLTKKKLLTYTYIYIAFYSVH